MTTKSQAHTPGLCPGLPDTVALDEKNFGEEYDAGPLCGKKFSFVKHSFVASGDSVLSKS